MNLAEWLRRLCEACREQISEDAAGAWIETIREWRMSDEQLQEILRRVVRYHRRSPLRLSDIDEVHADLVMETIRKQNMERIRKLHEEFGDFYPLPPRGSGSSDPQ